MLDEARATERNDCGAVVAFLLPYKPTPRMVRPSEVGAVEREFGRLKHHYALACLRVRGIERVRLHADLTMLGRLALALAKARAVPLAA